MHVFPNSTHILEKLRGRVLSSFGISPLAVEPLKAVENTMNIEGRPIYLQLLGFKNPKEREKITLLFTHTKHWQQPWQVVDDLEKADFLMVAADSDATFSTPPDIHLDRIIAYTEKPTALAKWHLCRSDTKTAPSVLDFMALINSVTETCTKRRSDSVSCTSPLEQEAVGTKVEVNSNNRLKVLVVGSVGSGKSTAIHSLSKNAISTEAKPSDHTLHQKATTTVGMDFGTLSVDGETQLMLYGAPGQRRFDFMSDVLEYNSFGIVIMINNDAADPLSDLNYYLDKHQAFLSTRPAVIGITHNDISPRPSVKQYRQFMNSKALTWPVYKVDARCETDMRKLISTLCKINL